MFGAIRRECLDDEPAATSRPALERSEGRYVDRTGEERGSERCHAFRPLWISYEIGEAGWTNIAASAAVTVRAVAPPPMTTAGTLRIRSITGAKLDRTPTISVFVPISMLPRRVTVLTAPIAAARSSTLSSRKRRAFQRKSNIEAVEVGAQLLFPRNGKVLGTDRQSLIRGVDAESQERCSVKHWRQGMCDRITNDSESGGIEAVLVSGRVDRN